MKSHVKRSNLPMILWILVPVLGVILLAVSSRLNAAAATVKIAA